MDDAEHDVLAHMGFPKEHWPQLHSTNPIERLNGEIKRRTDVVLEARLTAVRLALEWTGCMALIHL